MPRSFLVKKVKDGFCSADDDSAYIRHGADFPAHLSNKGYLDEYITASAYDGDSDRAIKVPSPDTLYTAVHSKYGTPNLEPPDSPQSETTGGYINGDAAVSEGYSMDAFFITDGRSRRKMLSGGRSIQRHSCSECDSAETDTCYNLKPGDLVVVKRHVRKHGLEPLYDGPYQVLLITQQANSK
ncbi:transcriptional repressor scratch 1 isoform X2 [Dendrobates tinctorius]|uniref:transcriptional repressor scratch 1 isoform X2 n=1 Tax=Dendrobates tinctorius TaxID=92724 RepID=UPI003CC9F8DE